MAATSGEIHLDFSPDLIVYKDGRFKRPKLTEFVPPSLDPVTGVQSKDVEISPELGVSARLFLPGNPNPSKKLPLVVYFHGSGFITESAFSPIYTKHLNFMVAKANAIAVSVNYRLAPEHPLPTAYEDCWLSLKWVASQSTEDVREKWIEHYADLNRVFLGGDSSGGNIAHHMAMRAGSEKLDGINITGAFLNCPFFYGNDPLGNEETHERLSRSLVERFWHLVCPGTTGFDDPRVNPAADPKLSGLVCDRLLVYVAEKDFLRYRGEYYKEALRKSGWDGEIEVVDVEGEDHAFSVGDPEGEQGKAMLKKVASFINDSRLLF